LKFTTFSKEAFAVLFYDFVLSIWLLDEKQADKGNEEG
jgi:hypothetical protein